MYDRQDPGFPSPTWEGSESARHPSIKDSLHEAFAVKRKTIVHLNVRRSLITGEIGLSRVMTAMANEHWENITQKKRIQRENFIEPFSSLINGELVDSEAILEIGDIKSLSELLSSGRLKSQDLIRFYAYR